MTPGISMLLQAAEDASPKMNFFDWPAEVWSEIIHWVLIIAVPMAILLLIRLLIGKYVKDDERRYYANKITSYVLFIITASLVAFKLLQVGVGNIATFFGLITAAVAISLQDFIASLGAWFVIMGSRLYRTGDRIEISTMRGDVVDIGLLRTTLLEIGEPQQGEQSTGRLITLPNSMVFKSAVYNFTTGSEYIWNEISLVLTFESDWKKGVEIIEEIAKKELMDPVKEAARKFKNLTGRMRLKVGRLTPIVYTRIVEHGVELTLRYITDARLRRVTQDKMNREMLDAINSDESMNLAYPTRRSILHSIPLPPNHSPGHRRETPHPPPANDNPYGSPPP